MPITQANIHDEFMRAGRLQGEGRFVDSAALWREILAVAPASAEAHANLAGALLELGRYPEAETAAREAVRLKPDAVWAHEQLARLLHQTRRLGDAEAAYLAALACDPGHPKARLGLGHLRLAQGDYAEGWPLFEARTEVAGQGARRLPGANQWRGEPLAGRSILIWPEQGFGDQIQFARFAPALQALGAEVTLAAPPELAPLFASLGVRIVPQTREPPADTGTDFWTLPLSIPRWLGTTPQTLPQPPYLAAPPARRERWRGHALAGTVGMVWQGRATPGNAHRSLSSDAMLRAPLEAAGARVLDLSFPLGDFADLAAVVETLDAVVTIDTAMAHLAGALGKRAFVLLPWFRTDWRWQEDRPDSPWYPSLTLFRQPQAGDWRTPIAAAAAAWRAEFRS